MCGGGPERKGQERNDRAHAVSLRCPKREYIDEILRDTVPETGVGLFVGVGVTIGSVCRKQRNNVTT